MSSINKLKNNFLIEIEVEYHNNLKVEIYAILLKLLSSVYTYNTISIISILCLLNI